MKKASILFVLIIFTLLCKTYSQVSVGAHYSTLNVPAAPFRAGGEGLDVEFSYPQLSWYLSDSYFSKTTAGAYYNDRYNIIELSAGFKAYFVGGNDLKKTVSFYLGGGGGYATNSVSPKYDSTAAYGDIKERLSTMNFDFMIGGDVKVRIPNWPVCKIFIQSRLSLGIYFITPDMDDEDIRAITNFQAGILVPLKKH